MPVCGKLCHRLGLLRLYVFENLLAGSLVLHQLLVEVAHLRMQVGDNRADSVLDVLLGDLRGLGLLTEATPTTHYARVPAWIDPFPYT